MPGGSPWGPLTKSFSPLSQSNSVSCSPFSPGVFADTPIPQNPRSSSRWRNHCDSNTSPLLARNYHSGDIASPGDQTPTHRTTNRRFPLVPDNHPQTLICTGVVRYSLCIRDGRPRIIRIAAVRRSVGEGRLDRRTRRSLQIAPDSRWSRLLGRALEECGYRIGCPRAWLSSDNVHEELSNWPHHDYV
jgi:hypothetical protein